MEYGIWQMAYCIRHVAHGLWYIAYGIWPIFRRDNVSSDVVAFALCIDDVMPDVLMTFYQRIYC